MEKKKIENKYLKKIEFIKKYNKHYYDKNSPLVDDHKYDELKKEILNLESKYEFLKSNFSPSQIVGFKPSRNFKKI
mgnify:FL=1